LVNALEQEKALGKAGQLAEMLTKIDLVILDELGYLPFSPSGGALMPHPRNRKRQLPLQGQFRARKENSKGEASVDQNITADKH